MCIFFIQSEEKISNKLSLSFQTRKSKRMSKCMSKFVDLLYYAA